MVTEAREVLAPPTASGFGVRVFFITLAGQWLCLGIVLALVQSGARDAAAVHLRDQLLMRARLVADRLSLEGRSPSEGVAWRTALGKLAEPAGARLTLRLRDGQVVADSALAPNAVPVAEHVLPVEAEQALRVGVGFGGSSEPGQTPPQVVVPWVAGGTVVGTLALESSEPQKQVSGIWLEALGWGALGSLVSAVLASVLAVRVFGRKANALARLAALDELGTLTSAQAQDPFVRLNDAVRSLSARVGSGALELATEKARLGRVLSSMNEGVLLVDADGCVRLANSALNDMLSVAAEPVGKLVDDVLETPQLVALIHGAPESEHQTVEVSSRQSPARKILASVRRLPQGAGVLAVFVDVTEQRRLETVRQEFVSNASHELRTPIAAILSAVETLQNIAAVKGEAEQNFMEMIARNALRLKALVDDLLALSHVESGAVPVQPEPVRLRVAVDGIMTDLAGQARARSTELVCNIADDLVVMASPRGLQHVITNLIDNAIKYCPPDSRVTVQAERGAGVAVISVTDNGPGIPEVHRDRIFERFYRIDAGRSRGLGGTGLGLSIVKHWVEAMGGTISVSAAPGGGTAFRVELSAKAA